MKLTLSTTSVPAAVGVLLDEKDVMMPYWQSLTTLSCKTVLPVAGVPPPWLRSTATPHSFAALFDGYVHDSLAGFNSPTLELTGYWRYRKIFLGNDEALIAANQDADAARNVA